MALTRMPFFAQAAAMEPVRLFTAALAAPYGAACGMASRLAPDDMLTIAPLLCAIIGLAAAFDRCQTALKFRASTFSKSSSGHLRIDLVSAPPAQLTSMSSLPNSPIVLSTRLRHPLAVVTSVGS